MRVGYYYKEENDPFKFMILSKLVILVGDWNVVLPNLHRGGINKGTYILFKAQKKSEFIARKKLFKFEAGKLGQILAARVRGNNSVTSTGF